MFGKKTPEFAPLDPEKVTVTDSGLGYEVIKAGEGGAPGETDSVTVHYTGYLEDGTVFDSSHKRGQTATFPLNRVIRGWTEGLQLMQEGGTTKFSIPGELAYGDRPPPGSGIPPGATLIFLVDLISVS
jgi:FKBP-type peptidyl-prolyl cis-trans isomerase